MLKMIDNTIDEMNNSKEMKYKSILLLSENEIKVLECIKRNVIIGAKHGQTDGNLYKIMDGIRDIDLNINKRI